MCVLWEWVSSKSLVNLGCQIFVSQDLIHRVLIFLRSRFVVKVCSIFEALTFWIILLRVGRLNESGFVKTILLVFFDKESIFFVWVVKRRESFICIFLWVSTICSKYSKESWSIRLNKEEICDGVSFLYFISERKFSICCILFQELV